ncbi:MAG: hypothetical protein PHQ52_07950, partial [Candidatus Omnitrophica bacterium]|nr:hypothetical protein [Candidatus Omnitrophota bacterium]
MLKLTAIDNDVMFFLGWQREEDVDLKNVLNTSIKQLSDLTKKVKKLKIPEKLSYLQKELLELIAQLSEFYDRIDLKEEETITEERDLFLKKISTYQKEAYKFAEDNDFLPELPDDFDWDEQELRFLSAKDQSTFNKAMKLKNDKQYKEAYELFEGLLKQYKGTMFEGSILTNMVDCRENTSSEMSKEDAGLESIEMLNDFMGRKIYSPRLYKIFEQWRTLFQMNNHGVSNWSIIPNEEYLDKRWTVIETIQGYVKEHPEDIEAKAQSIIVIDLPLVKRGLPMGNSTINHWGSLFLDREKEQ